MKYSLEENIERAKSIKLSPVINSTNISGIGYDESNLLLKVLFKNKENSSCYLYENVSPEVFNEIQTADSVSKKLYELIIRNKDKYKYIRL